FNVYDATSPFVNKHQQYPLTASPTPTTTNKSFVFEKVTFIPSVRSFNFLCVSIFLKAPSFNLKTQPHTSCSNDYSDSLNSFLGQSHSALLLVSGQVCAALLPSQRLSSPSGESRACRSTRTGGPPCSGRSLPQITCRITFLSGAK